MKNDKLVFFLKKDLPNRVIGINCTQGYTVTVSNHSFGSSISHEVISHAECFGRTLEQEVEKSVKWYRDHDYEECSETWFQTKRLNALDVVRTDVFDAILTHTAL